MPTASALMYRAAALHVSEGVPATPDTSVPVAESANVVRLAESLPPTPSAGGCCLEACLVVPICFCRQWVSILMRSGLLQEGPRLILTGRLVKGDICRRICNLAALVPHTTTEAATMPTAGASMHRAAAPHVAEGVPATPDPRVPIAESANMVRLAESPSPTPSA